MRCLDNRETTILHAISWALVLSLLALWSLGAWAFHAVAVWTVSNAGVLTTNAGAIVGVPLLPDWLASLVPPEMQLALTSTLSAVVPTIEAVVGQLPALAGGLSTAVWVVWGAGAIGLLVLGFVGSALIRLFQRHARGSAPLGKSAPSLG
jgi:hypothetical protein